MGYSLITAPAIEPVTTAEAKAHLRVDIADDDTLIDNLVKAAREQAESFTGRALLTQTWEYALDGFPAENHIDLPKPPLQSVTSVTYYDTDGAAHTFAATSYYVDKSMEPGRLVLDYGETWPSETLRPSSGAVVIKFKAGYGDAATTVPQSIRQAILLLVGHWYEAREAIIVGTISTELPMTVKYLLWPSRMLRFS